MRIRGNLTPAINMGGIWTLSPIHKPIQIEESKGIEDTNDFHYPRNPA